MDRFPSPQTAGEGGQGGQDGQDGLGYQDGQARQDGLDGQDGQDGLLAMFLEEASTQHSSLSVSLSERLQSC